MLLIGSLPPTRSHAALLTHAVAMAATENGIDVVCLIDALAPPPDEDLPYRVVRSFDSFIQNGAADDLPRLFVVGSKGDSLPVIEALHAAPGAVISATHSMFDLALPWLQTSSDFPSNFSAWLAAKYGDAGTAVAEGFTQHRRMAKKLIAEIPAFDLLLAPATCHLSLGHQQFSALTEAGFKPKEIALPPVQHSTDQKHISPMRITVIGASSAVETAVVDAQKSGAFPRDLSVTFYDRYSAQLDLAISTSVSAVILDGHDAVFCPHFQRLAANTIPTITAGQHWAKELPIGAQCCLTHPASPISVVHMLAALADVAGMMTGLKNALAKWQAKRPDATDWAPNLLATAATAKPTKLAALTAIQAPIKKPTLSPASNSGENTEPASGIMALVGAVPDGPLLHHLYPKIDAERCPKFMNPSTAQTLSTFMGLPAAKILDHMGFEAPLIAEKTSNESPLNLANKTRHWADIQLGLRHAKNALAFGCSIDGAKPANQTVKKVSWSFTVPPEVMDSINTPKAINSAYDTNAGLYWVHDPVRGSLKCALFTGGPGALEFSSSSTHSFVITDLTSTKTLLCTESCAFTINDNGLALFKVAALPTENNNYPNLMKMLAEDGLHLEWSGS